MPPVTTCARVSLKMHGGDAVRDRAACQTARAGHHATGAQPQRADVRALPQAGMPVAVSMGTPEAARVTHRAQNTLPPSGNRALHARHADRRAARFPGAICSAPYRRSASPHVSRLLCAAPASGCSFRVSATSQSPRDDPCRSASSAETRLAPSRQPWRPPGPVSSAATPSLPCMHEL